MTQAEFNDLLNQINKATETFNASSELTFEQWKKIRSEYKKFNEEISKSTNPQQTVPLKEAIGKLTDVLSSAGDITTYLSNKIKKATEDLHFFATNWVEIYKYGELTAEQYYSINKQLGISGEKSNSVRLNFSRAIPDVIRMGGKMEDMVQLWTNFSEASGRQNIISSDDMINMNAFVNATGISTAESAKLYENFNSLGISIGTASKKLEGVMNSSNKIGLNSKKVLEVLASNMSTMQSYSFVNGVKGMTEMAKLAVRMKGDVNEMLNMSDKFYNPEGAIETAAELQLMGGDIAAAFGDPIEMMYLARNKPEELAKKISTMTENMLLFNEETKEYELPPEALQQLTFAAGKLGISRDRMVEIARQSSKIKDIKMNVSGNITDEDTIEMLAGMAQMKDGDWKVNVEGQEIAIADITEEQAKKLSSLPEQTFKDQAQSTMTNTEAIKANTDAIKYEIATFLPFYANIDAALKKPMQKTFNAIGSVSKGLAETNVGSMMQSTDMASQIGNILSGGIDDVISFIGPFLKEGGKFTDEKINEIINQVKKIASENSSADLSKLFGNKKNDDFIWRSGSESIQQFNKGDIIMGGTNILNPATGGIIDKNYNNNSNISGKLDVNVNMPSTITVNVAGDSKNVDLNDSNLKNIILKYVETSLRDGVDNSKVSGSGIYTTPGNQSFK